jgi:serine/threonine protein kinase
LPAFALRGTLSLRTYPVTHKIAKLFVLFCLKHCEAGWSIGIIGREIEARQHMSEGKVGQVIGSYKLLGVLGEGGMGIVYKAEHTMLGRKVALKMLLAEYAEQSDIVERFFTEAKSVNKIGHKNIIDIIDYGTSPDNCPFFIMELLEGEELAKLLEREGSIEISRAINIVKQIAGALEACHAAGVLHRDLKPENIFILPSQNKRPESVKVLDFGIAKLMEKKDDVTLTSKTKTGVVIGTPQYMAPEQVRRQPLDARTDLYALGLVFYEMLVGQQPFVAESFPDLVVKMLTEPLVLPTEKNPLIPKPIEAVIVKMLERKKENRHQSMAEFLIALEEAEEQCSILSLSPTISPTQGVSRGTGPQTAPASLRLTPLPIQTEIDFSPAHEEKPRQKNPTTLSLSAAEADPKKSNKKPKTSVIIAAALAIAGGAALFFTLQPPQKTPQTETVTAQKQRIEISFSGMLEGIDVYEGEQKLGTLPYSLQVESSDVQRTFSFQKEGYTNKTKTILLNSNQSFEISLEKATLPQSKEQPTPTTQPTETAKTDPSKKNNKDNKEKPPKNNIKAHTDPPNENTGGTPPPDTKGNVLKPCFLDPTQAHCKAN